MSTRTRRRPVSGCSISGRSDERGRLQEEQRPSWSGRIERHVWGSGDEGVEEEGSAGGAGGKVGNGKVAGLGESPSRPLKNCLN